MDIIQNEQGVKLIVNTEEYSIIGGLEGTGREYLSGLSEHPPLLIFGLPDEFMHAGTYEWLIKEWGLTPNNISERIYHQLK